jgi:FAD/FMN-containing dehydrogenase
MQTTSAVPTRPVQTRPRLLAPGGSAYEEARTVWNATVDHRPAAIAPCAGTEEVRAAVAYGREAGLEIGVRCGGHNIAGLAVPDGGLMIDLRPSGHVRVDPIARRAVVGGGAMLGALDRAAQRHGLATTAGNVSHTGVGGLTLGGGMGWLARKHGLTCDNVLAYTLVTAEGEVVRVDAESEPELFWGLRGGGGNFGIVTEFEFRLHPVPGPTVSVGIGAGSGDAAGEAMAGWRELAAGAPREATFTASLHGDQVDLGFVWIGRPDRTVERLVERLARLVPERGARVEELSYLELQTRDDTVEGHAVRRYWKGHYLPGLPDEAIAALLAGRGATSPNVSLQAYGGAIGEVADSGSAFDHRGTRFEYVAATGWTDPDEDDARRAAVRADAARIAPFARGAYVNALSDEGRGGVRRAYGEEKLRRLRRLKDRFDPQNVFHLNHNIAPTGH